MNFRPTPLDTAVPVDLALEEEFRLGETVVRPSLLEVSRAGKAATLEPRVMQVLTVLARRPGSVTSRDELVATCWAGRFIGEDAIQRTIAKLRHAAEADAGGDFFIETVPRVGYRLVLKGVPADAAPDAAQRKPRRAPWVGLAAGLVLLAAAGAAAFMLWPRLAPVPSVRLAGLTAVGDVPVAIPAGMDAELRRVFGQENAILVKDGPADYVLQGSIQRQGDTDRYAMRLTAAKDDAVIWSHTLERPAVWTRAPQDAAQAVVRGIRCGLSGARGHGKALPTHALLLYFQYCDARTIGPSSPRRALDIARRVVAEAPEFANGWAAVAMSAKDVLLFGLPSGDVHAEAATRAEGERAAAQALRLDRRNGEAYYALAWLKPPAALAEKDALFHKALAARPLDCGCEHNDYGLLLMNAGRFREAGEHFDRALDMMPFDTGPRFNKANVLFMGGHVDEGVAVMMDMKAEFDPMGARMADRLVAARRGQWAAVATNLDPTTLPARRAALEAAAIAAAANDPAAKAAAAAGLVAAPPPRFMGAFEPQLLLALGDRAAALEFLAGQVSPTGLTYPLFDPKLKALREEPRYLRMLETSGLMAYWKATRTQPDLCAEADAPAFCAKI